MFRVYKISIILAALMMITACGSVPGSKDGTMPARTASTGEKVRILFLSISDSEIRNDIREKYIKANVAKEMPDVEVEYDLGGGGQDYASKLKTYNSSGDMPDVWFSEQNLSTVVITAGNALDLAPYIRETGFARKYKMPELIAPDKYGRIFCVQSGNDQYCTPRLWYHKDMLVKYDIQVPKTFDELVDACKRLKENGIIPISIVGKDGWTLNLHLLQTMIMAEDPGVALELSEYKTDFNNPVVRNALVRIQKLALIGAFALNVSSIDYSPAMDMYTSGKAAMLAMFSWELANLERAAPDTGFIPWPAARAGVDPNYSIQYWGAPLSGYMTSAKTKYPSVAARFAMFCATQDALYYNIESKSPTALDTGVPIDGMSALAKKDLEQFNAAGLKIPSLWAATFNTKMSAEIAVQNSKLLTGHYSPDDYIKAINPVWKEEINEAQKG